MDSPAGGACRWVVIDVPRAEVFGIVEEPGHMERFHPFCERNEITAWADNDHRDRIRYYSGLLIERVVTEWAPPSRIRLAVGQPGNPHPRRVQWDFATIQGDRTRVTLTIDPSSEGGLGPDVLEPYFDSLLAGLKYYVETGTPVTRNQFGSNPVFSP